MQARNFKVNSERDKKPNFTYRNFGVISNSEASHSGFNFPLVTCCCRIKSATNKKSPVGKFPASSPGTHSL